MFEQPELTIGVLELFAEQMARASRKALVATSESTPERVGGKPKLKLFGFNVCRSFEANAAFQWRREAKEQRELNERARRKRTRAEFYAANRGHERATQRAWLASLSAEHRAARRAKATESMRQHRRRLREAREQARRLAAWKASAVKQPSKRTAKQLEQRRAQAKRRRERMKARAA